MRHGQSANDRPKVLFERLTVLTDHDTRASGIYTGNRIPETCLQHRVPIHDNYSYTFMNLDSNHSLILRHNLRDLSLVGRGIDCIEHDFDDKICADGRLCLTEGGCIHHVLINNAISFIRVKTCCGY